MAMNPKRKLAIIVVNYGSHELLETNIAPVSGHAPDVSVVVVDNYTDRTERDAVASLVARRGWTLVAPETNLGFGAGMNLGVEAAARAGARAFLLINPDATLGMSSLQLLRDAVEHNPMAVVAPPYRPVGREVSGSPGPQFVWRTEKPGGDAMHPLRCRPVSAVG